MTDDVVEVNGVEIEQRWLGGLKPNYCPFCGSDDLDDDGSGARCKGQCGKMFWVDS